MHVIIMEYIRYRLCDLLVTLTTVDVQIYNVFFIGYIGLARAMVGRKPYE